MSRALKYLPWVAMIAVMVLAYASQSGYWLTIAMTIVIWTILASGLNIMLGLAGYYHMGVGAFYGIGAYGAAIMSVRLGMPMYVSLVTIPVLSALVSVVIGPVVLRIRGLHFAVATLAMSMIASDVTNNWTAMTGGPLGIAGIKRPGPLDLPFIGVVTQFQATFVVGCIILLVIMGIYARLRTSPFALVLRGLKSDEMQTRAFGYSTMRYKVGAFALSGAIASVAGVVYAYFIQYVSPEPFTFAASSFQAFVIVAVGGPGSLWGPMIGSVILVALPEMLDLQPQLRLMIYGAVLLSVIVLLPKGLASLSSRWFSGRRSRAEDADVGSQNPNPSLSGQA